MVNTSMRLKILILPLSLAAAVIVTIFYINPSYSDMNTAKKTLSEKQTQLDTLKQQSQKLEKMKAQWDALNEEKTLVQTALPEAEDVDVYISEVTNKATRSGVLLTDIRLDKTASAAESAPFVCSAASADAAASSSGGVLASPTAATPAGNGSGTLSSSPANLSDDCLNTYKISMTAKGTWDQLLGFFKYLEDMNRISNIGEATISTENQSQGQPSSDLLSVNVSMNAYFKEKNQDVSPAFVASFVNQDQLNQKALEKLKAAIYSPYAAPEVSPAGQRNIFK